MPMVYLPDSGGVSLPVQRAEKLSSATCRAGLIAPQLKFTCWSVLTIAASPFSSRLLKYSALSPAGAPPPPVVKAEAGTGSTETPVGYIPAEERIVVAGETLFLMPASGVTDFEGWPL